MPEISLRFHCADLSLEGVLSVPEGKGPFPAVVVCHPHPLYGGNMENNVVIAVSQALLQESIAAFRFNFRGVDDSDGEFGQGIGEQEDLKAALSFVSEAEKIDPERIGLCGYSFGAGIVISVALQDKRVQAMAAISPTVWLSSFDLLKGYAKPKLFLCGGRDYFVPHQELERFVDGLAEPKSCEIIPEADHFWWGYEDEAAAKVAAFFAHSLGR